MAKCPQCGCPQKWIELLSLNKRKSIVCRNCGVELRCNRARAAQLLGIFFVFGCLPLTPWVMIEFDYYWIGAVAAATAVAWVNLVKLETAHR